MSIPWRRVKLPWNPSDHPDRLLRLPGLAIAAAGFFGSILHGLSAHALSYPFSLWQAAWMWAAAAGGVVLTILYAIGRLRLSVRAAEILLVLTAPALLLRLLLGAAAFARSEEALAALAGLAFSSLGAWAFGAYLCGVLLDLLPAAAEGETPKRLRRRIDERRRLEEAAGLRPESEARLAGERRVWVGGLACAFAAAAAGAARPMPPALSAWLAFQCAGYWLAGFLMIALLHRLVLQTEWKEEKIKADPSVRSRWLQTAAFFAACAVGAALLAPAGVSPLAANWGGPGRLIDGIAEWMGRWIERPRRSGGSGAVSVAEDGMQIAAWMEAAVLLALLAGLALAAAFFARRFLRLGAKEPNRQAPIQGFWRDLFQWIIGRLRALLRRARRWASPDRAASGAEGQAGNALRGRTLQTRWPGRVREPRQVMRRLFLKYLRRQRARGAPRLAPETAREFTRRAAGGDREAAGLFVSLYEQARYSRWPFPRQGVRQAAGALRRLLRSGRARRAAGVGP